MRMETSGRFHNPIRFSTRPSTKRETGECRRLAERQCAHHRNLRGCLGCPFTGREYL
jgi:hypothetical protein